MAYINLFQIIILKNYFNKNNFKYFIDIYFIYNFNKILIFNFNNKLNN